MTRPLRDVSAGKNRRLVVQDNIEEGAMYVDATVVLQEVELPELLHEETHP